MEELAAVKTIEKKSKFYAHLYRIDSGYDLEDITKAHRSMYRKARHHCYGARVPEDGTIRDVFKNDGEVGHPGQVLLEILKREGMNDHCLMVSRIFGGIKLGVGGVSRAFRDAGDSAVRHYRE